MKNGARSLYRKLCLRLRQSDTRNIKKMFKYIYIILNKHFTFYHFLNIKFKSKVRITLIRIEEARGK